LIFGAIKGDRAARFASWAEHHKQAVLFRVEAHRSIIKVLGAAACKGDERPDCPILNDLSRARQGGGVCCSSGYEGTLHSDRGWRPREPERFLTFRF
jgi:hypothetical protein